VPARPQPMLDLADIAPMLLTGRRPPVPAPGWLYELKHDGYRVLARVGGGRVELRTRNGADCRGWYPEIVAGLAGLHGQHLIDGEVCVLDEVGRPSFDRLQDHSRRRCWYVGADPVAFLAFDLLAHRGADIRAWPVERRKAALQEAERRAAGALQEVGGAESARYCDTKHTGLPQTEVGDDDGPQRGVL
jgi:bifunctional non-homologous end joining protein LigD